MKPPFRIPCYSVLALAVALAACAPSATPLGPLEFWGRDLEITRRGQSSRRGGAGRCPRRRKIGSLEFETTTGRKIPGDSSVQPNERRLF